jgi:structural maintenance of chromosome 3 (chondroitin sulfate proteoglycan 6)
LFECESQFNKAIEVTAQSRLFYHVVEDDGIATAIINRINKRGLPGEVNFYPLNRLLAADIRSVKDKVSQIIL